MSEKRKCLCCGKEYDYCPNCGKSSTPWKVNYDTEACKEIFNAVSAYNMKKVGEDYIKEILNKYSITDFYAYKKDIKELLSKLFNGKSQNIEIENNEVQDIVPEEPVVEETPVKLEETEIPETVEHNNSPRRRRNRFYE